MLYRVSVKHFSERGTWWKLFYPSMIAWTTTKFKISRYMPCNFNSCRYFKSNQDLLQRMHTFMMQVLHETVESYFEGQLFKNKIWVGIVEGL